MKIPPFLEPGDKVGIVAPAKKVNEQNTLNGLDILRSWDLEVVIGEHVFNENHPFAGTDDERTEDFQRMIDDHKIKAIFMARGGYGSTRIIDQINFDALINQPKWICGFSDITAFHLHLYNLGIVSLHAPMPSTFYFNDKPSLNRMRSLLFGKKEALKTASHFLNEAGIANGRLIGGNLAIICSCIGTKSEINPDGNILFIEDVGEQLYNVDRMMVQLKRAGLLKNLSGFIAGQFSDMKDGDDPFGQSAYEIIHSHIKEYNYPIAFDLPIGHTERNHAIPIGIPAMLNITDSETVLSLEGYKTGN